MAWGGSRGVDVEAKRDQERWLIEAKGSGAHPQARKNYFLAILGQILCTMEDPKAKYSIALPDLPQFRKLWTKLPNEAKARTRITALFVDEIGEVTEDSN